MKSVAYVERSRNDRTILRGESVKINDRGYCLVIIDSYHYPLMVAESREDDYLILVNLETSIVTKTEFRSITDLVRSIPGCLVTRRRFSY